MLYTQGVLILVPFELIVCFWGLQALGLHGFPIPNAVDRNRHCVIMSLVQGYPLVQVKQLQNPDEIFDKIMSLVVRLAEHSLIHCDFKEFNIMVHILTFNC
ncbi:hypothetical protein KSP39_PZI011525 [Platanthera zijinensis]|uniref:non-specific serine/threonine protein kinase n=1 Tax=Platanthera zijinensis TaxID=2320716 RepID=A0AAP0BI23_9ASPA